MVGFRNMVWHIFYEFGGKIQKIHQKWSKKLLLEEFEFCDLS